MAASSFGSHSSSQMRVFDKNQRFYWEITWTSNKSFIFGDKNRSAHCFPSLCLLYRTLFQFLLIFSHLFLILLILQETWKVSELTVKIQDIQIHIWCSIVRRSSTQNSFHVHGEWHSVHVYRSAALRGGDAQHLTACPTKINLTAVPSPQSVCVWERVCTAFERRG